MPSSNNRGNFIEILKWASATDPIVKSILDDSANNATYMSHHVQNELLNIMANQIREKVSAEVISKNFYFYTELKLMLSVS